MFLELSLIPIRFLIMKRRINFLHYILRQNEESLLVKFFLAQSQENVSGDWVNLVKSDLNSIQIELSFEAIKQYPKDQFKQLVNERIKRHAFDWLKKEKNKLSSVKDMTYDKFEIQDYFITDKLTRDKKQLLFQMRTKTIALFGYRKFEHKDGNINCPFCDLEPDLLPHQMTCTVLNKGIYWPSKQQNNINDIYSAVLETKVNILMIFETIYKRRSHLMKYFKTA